MINYTKEDLIELEKPSKPIKAIKINEDVFIAGPDITKTTADTNTVLKGYKFYNAYGKLIEGEAQEDLVAMYKCIQAYDDGTWIGNKYLRKTTFIFQGKTAISYEVAQSMQQSLNWTKFKPVVGNLYTKDALVKIIAAQDADTGAVLSASLQDPIPAIGPCAAMPLPISGGSGADIGATIYWNQMGSDSFGLSFDGFFSQKSGILFQNLYIGHNRETGFLSDFTYSVWCRTTQTMTSQHPQFCIASLGSYASSLDMYRASPTHCRIMRTLSTVELNVGISLISFPLAADDTDWHQYAVVYNCNTYFGGIFSLYIDGIFCGNGTTYPIKNLAAGNPSKVSPEVFTIGIAETTQTGRTRGNYPAYNTYFARAQVYSYAKDAQMIYSGYKKQIFEKSGGSLS